VFSGVFIAEEVGVGNMGSGDTTMLKALLRSACLNAEAFLWQKEKLHNLGTAFLKCQIIHISELSDIRLKELFCIIIM
jgi:ABC-type cobalamin/Fe3+-siderophores transport system ATPase subunit